MSPNTAKVKASGEGARAAQPARKSAIATPAQAWAQSFHLLIGEILQLVERLHRLARRKLVGIERGEAAPQAILPRRGRGSAREEVVLRPARPQLLLQLGQVPARGAHHVLGDSGEVCHVD